ncbi:sugar ABC transporter ATP-binding protein [Pseudomonas putida]|uniref:Sugar ABC transporter ATP-binding protein n=1 Tax=Pseudomonas putida TaxID=303 RepID=A0A379KR66_PSEPU|nr:ABC transporter ATP-binding protein [Pseudomonas putida]SUD70562.1 sugar ABC transporter ATP-binding protein [Pseudomonas putida]
MAEIRLRQLAHSYSRQPTAEGDYALHQLEHVWEQGGAYALLGPSGCGKSTLLNIISGLLTPSHGQVLFDGKPVNDLSPQQRNIAQVFQFPVVYDTMTVFDNLAFPLRNQGLDEARVRTRVEEIAEVLDLGAVLKKKARNLSADEKQKVSMGRGLVRDDVSAILFDEPLTVIDPHLKWKLRRKLKQIHEQFNITMIYVTHDQLEASTFADKIAVMHGGRIVQFGTPRELFERPRHTFVGYFIGSPGMNLIDVRADAAGVAFGDVHLALPDGLRERLAGTSGGRLQVGIRPEFVQLWDSPFEGALPARVLDVEDLGTYRIVTLVLGGVALKARLAEDRPVPVAHAWVSLPTQWLLLYVDDLLLEAVP